MSTLTFISPIIQEWIYRNCTWRHETKIYSRIHLVLHAPEDVSYLIPYFKYYYLGLVDYMLMSGQPISSKNIIIDYYHTPFEKKIPDIPGSPLNHFHVNSGMTSIKGDHCHISIWRSEEAMKVFIHELIHCYNLETCHQLTRPPSNGFIVPNYQDISKELFTELQTWWLYQVLTSDLTGIPADFESERQWSIDQALRILQHYSITDRGQIIDLRCSALYYYIYKGIILYFYPHPYIDAIIHGNRDICLDFTNFLEYCLTNFPITRPRLKSRSLRMMCGRT